METQLTDEPTQVADELEDDGPALEPYTYFERFRVGASGFFVHVSFKAEPQPWCEVSLRCMDTQTQPPSQVELVQALRQAYRTLVNGTPLMADADGKAAHTKLRSKIQRELTHWGDLWDPAAQTFPTTLCKSCRARIIWAKTVNGKAMPVDADTSRPDANIILGEGSDGLVASVTQPGRGFFVSHFAVCPAANNHRT